MNADCVRGLQDTERAGMVYQAALKLIPHERFTFGKLWLMAANFYVRQKDVAQARKLLGLALGKYVVSSSRS